MSKHGFTFSPSDSLNPLCSGDFREPVYPGEAGRAAPGVLHPDPAHRHLWVSLGGQKTW